MTAAVDGCCALTARRIIDVPDITCVTRRSCKTSEASTYACGLGAIRSHGACLGAAVSGCCALTARRIAEEPAVTSVTS